MSTGELVVRWLIAFSITQLVECPVYSRGFRVKLSAAFAASAITHPIVTLVMPALWGSTLGQSLSSDVSFVLLGAAGEVFAVAVEALWLLRRTELGARRAFIASLSANVASAAVGGLVYLVTGYP